MRNFGFASRLILMLGATIAIAPAAPAQIESPSALVSIPLRDSEGVVRAHMTYRRGRDGNTIIYFVDAATRTQIGAIGAERAAPAPNPVEAGGPRVGTVRDHRTGTGDSSGGIVRDHRTGSGGGGAAQGSGSGRRPNATDDDIGRADSANDVRQLRQQIDLLTTNVRALERRLDALSRRP